MWKYYLLGSIIGAIMTWYFGPLGVIWSVFISFAIGTTIDGVRTDIKVEQLEKRIESLENK